MTPQERIIRNALKAIDGGRANYGEGGKAAVKIYHEGKLSPESMLYTIAIMANGLADLEPLGEGE